MKDVAEESAIKAMQLIGDETGLTVGEKHSKMDRQLLDFLCSLGYGRLVDSYIEIQNVRFPFANWYGRRT